jgi:CubicO group peptidase (beta-lactamase class C family)
MTAMSNDTDLTPSVDRLFAEWDKPDSPGASLAIVREGRLLYSKGYGRANLEYDIPNTPSTPFHIASVSKQFTAFAIHLLAREGKLSLDDDVRKYLPELHDFGKTITLRHLLHHTSGLRDQWDLLQLAGWRLDDVVTEDDILRLVWRQRELNFTPGEKIGYCNTGYTLLALIVKRVSGRSLRDFSRERIFEPLGMTRTHFHDDVTEWVKNRADSYDPRDGGGFRKAILSFSNVGATGLFSTAEDLAKWDRNFEEQKVGGPAVWKEMLRKAKLMDGREVDYASGLVIARYKGDRMVMHEGMDAGFRAVFLRFPDRRLTVILLANLGSIHAVRLAFSVADLFLESDPGVVNKAPGEGQAPEPEYPDVKIDVKTLDRYAGDYWFGRLDTLRLFRDGDRLFLKGPHQNSTLLYPRSRTEFFSPEFGGSRYTFEKRKGEYRLVRRRGNETMTGVRRKPEEVTAKTLQEYEGRYYSEELESVFTLKVRDGKLYVGNRREELPVTPVRKDILEGDITITFERSRNGKVSGARITTALVHLLRIVKM